jgi:acetyl esterase/lipase
MNALLLRQTVLLPILLVLAAPARAAEARPALQETYDLRYGKDSDFQKLDMIAPKNARDLPVVVFVHGGAWMIGDKNLFGIYRNVGRNLARMNAVVALINYRLAPSVKYEKQVEDVARAYAWVRRHIADYGGDPERILLAGHSAGGHLAALFATDERYWRDPDLGLKDADRKALRGVAAVCGVYRIPGPEDCARVVGAMLSGLPDPRNQRARAALAMIPALVRTTPSLNPFRLVFGDDPAVFKEASPLSHVRKGLRPFLVLYAEYDLPLLSDQAKEFAAALKAAGVPVEIQRIKGGDHNTILWWMHNPRDPAALALRQFLDAHIRTAKS